MNLKIQITKNTTLNFDCFEDSKTVVKPWAETFNYQYYSCEYNEIKYFIRIKEQFRNDKWEQTSKSFATSLNAKKWESKLTDILLKKRDN